MHVGLVLVLAAWLTEPRPEAGDTSLAGDWSEPDQVELDLKDVEEPNLRTKQVQPSGGRTAGQVVALNQTLTSQAVREPRDDSPAPEFPFDDPDFVRMLARTVHAETRGRGRGDGRGDGSGGGATRGLGFFGEPVPGKSYAYVLDCSRSMNYPHGGKWKSRMKRLKAELVRSVGTLAPENHFFIVFFNDEPRPMPARRLQAAVPATKQFYLKWAIAMKPDGETKPAGSLRLALKLQPDVIHFLTDGQFEPKIHRILKKIRQDRTVIHTYALGNPDSEKILRELAASNGGKYHFIP